MLARFARFMGRISNSTPYTVLILRKPPSSKLDISSLRWIWSDRNDGGGARMFPQDLRYHQEHEWVRVSGTQATVGISHFAQDALGDIGFNDLPKPGTVVKAGQQIGEV